MRFQTSLVIFATILVALFSLSAINELEALPTFGALTCAKNYMINLLKEKIIGRSALVSSFNVTMTNVRARYEQAKFNGELEGKDDAEQSAFYYKIMIEELRSMRQQIETQQYNPDAELGPEDHMINSCVAVADDVDKKYMEPTKAWDPEAVADEEEELKLLSELDQLEQTALQEAEMGWSLTPEVQAELKLKTKAVVLDLLNNEIRQLAMAILSAYMSGGTITAVLVSVSGPIKFKLVEFFMNAILDVVSAILGRRVQINADGTKLVDQTPVVVAPAAATKSGPVPMDID